VSSLTFYVCLLWMVKDPLASYHNQPGRWHHTLSGTSGPREEWRMMTTFNVLALFSGAGAGAMVVILMVAWALDR
jgi:hypothetical protein